MEQAGYAPYVDAVKQAVQDTRLTATEASALPPAGTGRVTMKLPEKMAVSEADVALFLAQAQEGEASGYARAWVAADKHIITARRNRAMATL